MSKSERRFISGIHNYCDYWCEHCAFTRRCRIYIDKDPLREKSDGNPLAQDATNAAFWNRLADKLRETSLFGDKRNWDDTSGATFDDVPDEDWLEREEALQEASRRHVLCTIAEEYRKQAGAWLDAADADLKALADELMNEAANPFTQDDIEERARKIGEMIDVVAWYHTFIQAKVYRAVSGLVRSEEEDEPESDMLAEIHLHDANGSGKVAWVAIERSIGAWLHLRETLPERESEILSLLTLLDRLRRGIQAALPGARTFLRPGFDGETDENEQS